MARHRGAADSPEHEDRHTALADLLKEQGFMASEKPEHTAPAGKTRSMDLSKNGKIVIRRERKGHGGKTVTIVSGIERATPQLEEIARAMRKALGCGSTVEGRDIVLQGENVPRAQVWLQAHGATRLVVSG